MPGAQHVLARIFYDHSLVRVEWSGQMIERVRVPPTCIGFIKRSSFRFPTWPAERLEQLLDHFRTHTVSVNPQTGISNDGHNWVQLAIFLGLEWVWVEYE